MTVMAKKTAKKPAAPTAVPKVAAKENNTSKPSKKALRKALAAQKAQLLQKKNTKEQSKVEGQENAIVIAPVRKSDEPLVQTQVSLVMLHCARLSISKYFFRHLNGSTSNV